MAQAQLQLRRQHQVATLARPARESPVVEWQIPEEGSLLVIKDPDMMAHPDPTKVPSLSIEPG